MKFKDALWYLIWLSLGAALIGGILGSDSVFGIFFAAFISCIMAIIFLSVIGVWEEMKDLSLEEVWACRRYNPNMAALWNFANQGSGFIYNSDKSRNTDEVDYYVQCLAQKTRDLIDDLVKQQIKLPYSVKVKLYLFTEKEKSLKILEDEYANGKDFAMAMLKLADIMNCNTIWNNLSQWDKDDFKMHIAYAARAVKQGFTNGKDEHKSVPSLQQINQEGSR